MKMSQRGRRIALRCAAAIVVLSLVWFIGIVESAYFEVCTKCGSRHYAVETRIFGVLVSERFVGELETFAARIAKDLGVPCAHTMVRRLKERRLGFLWTFDQNLGMSIYTDVPDWYKKNSKAIIAALRARNPALPEEFRDKMLLKSDYDYLWRVIHSMEELCPAADREHRASY